MTSHDKYELIEELARRRGFFWQSFEIYGGVGGFLDLGPLGTMMKRKLEEKWLDTFVRSHGFLEVSTPIIAPEKVFVASGHIQHFKDPMVECAKCKRRFKADSVVKEATQLEAESLTLEQLQEVIRERQVRCLECGGELSKPQYISTMFKTTIGPYSESIGYCRPEAAQGMFIDFKRLYEIARCKLPLAIAQIGTVLRNEISPRQGPIRLREFTIMELELFYNSEDPRCPYLNQVEDDELPLVPLELRQKGIEEPVSVSVREALQRNYIIAEWSAYFMALSKSFFTSLGIPPECQRFQEKFPTERAHYSLQTYDHQVWLDRWGWVELAGHANRGDYDLRGHIRESGTDLSVFKMFETPVTREVRKVIPIMSKLGLDFKEDAPRIRDFLSKLEDPSEVERSFKMHGFYEIEGFKILPEHVEIRSEIQRESGRRFIPSVIEPSFGAERILYAVLEYAYTRVEDRTVLKIPIDLVPVQLVILPLVAKDGLPEKAKELYELMRHEHFSVEYDDSGTIGRRYARSDEIGVPIAVTVDYQTLEDGTVTLRNRDSWKQFRADSAKLPEILRRYFAGNIAFEEMSQMLDDLKG